jgi:hypothetical protein
MPTTATPNKKAQASNSAATGFQSTFLPTATLPTRAGFHTLDFTGETRGSFVWVQPFGTDANNETFDMRVWGWSLTQGLSTPLYIPMLLGEFNVTLGNIAATEIAANTFIADTIVAAGTDGIYVDGAANIFSPANDRPAYFELDLKGSQYIEFDFDSTASATSNAFWRLFG